MKKTVLFATAMILCTLSIYSQKTRDVLYLKNGSVINGTLFEISDNQYKIRTIDKNTFVFNSAEVDKFVKEGPVFEGRKKDGFGFTMEAGFLVGSQHSEYKSPFSFNCLVNYTTNVKNIFGVGSGVEFIGQTYTPVFVEYKRIISDRKTTPFLFFRGGGLTHIAEFRLITKVVYRWELEQEYHGLKKEVRPILVLPTDMQRPAILKKKVTQPMM
jgi:hypothetical protein